MAADADRQITTVAAAAEAGVDRSTIMTLRKTARDGALAASRPGRPKQRRAEASEIAKLRAEVTRLQDTIVEQAIELAVAWHPAHRGHVLVGHIRAIASRRSRRRARRRCPPAEPAAGGDRAYGIDEAVTLGALKPDQLLLAVEALGGRGRAVVTDEVAGPVSHGRVLDVDDLGVAGEGPWPVVDATGKLLAVYQGHHRQARRRAGRQWNRALPSFTMRVPRQGARQPLRLIPACSSTDDGTPTSRHAL